MKNPFVTKERANSLLGFHALATIQINSVGIQQPDVHDEWLKAEGPAREGYRSSRVYA